MSLYDTCKKLNTAMSGGKKAKMTLVLVIFARNSTVSFAAIGIIVSDILRPNVIDTS